MTRLVYSLTLVGLCAATLARAADPPAFDEGRFELQVLIEPLTQPMQFEVAPDGKIYLIELGGALKRFDPATHQLTVLATLDVFAEQENGLIGLALDPHFQQNHWLYLQYSPKTYSGQHVSRFTVAGEKLDLKSEKLLLQYQDQRRECCHHAGSMRFDAAGNLYIASGDNTNPGMSDGYSPLDERKDHFPRDSQKSASNTADLRGKILRIHPNADGTASIPDGNLFPKDGSKGRPEIYVMGCRNPWRISVDSKTGILYWGEVGPDAWGDSPRGPRGYDEINQARKPGNFGWPYFIANNRPYARFDFATNKVGDKYDPAHPANHSPNNTGRVDLPPAEPAWIYYPYGRSEEFPELGEGGRTACAGPVFHADPAQRNPNRFPEYYDNCLFIFDWSRNWIKAVRLDARSNLVRIEPFLSTLKFKRPIDMRFGPDGACYLLEYGETWGVNKDSRLSRIDYVRGNRPPIARATATNNVGKEPLNVSFSSKGTFDKDGDALTYAWSLVSGGVEQPFSTNPDASYQFKKPGSYNVKLTVTDAHGAASVATVAVLVGNTPPRVAFRAPLDGGFFDWGKPVVYHVVVDDAEDGSSEDHALDMSPRVTVQAEFKQARPEDALAEKSPDPSDDPPPLRLIKSADCFNCHAFDHRVIGPAFAEIAAKYHNDPKALDASVQRVLNGSTGVWGQLAMLPHAQHTPQQVREMVSWVYALDVGQASARHIARGLDGDVDPGPAPRDHRFDSGTLVLEAAYQDNGAAGLPPITGTARVTLRTRKVEAEHASQIHGAKVLDGGTASGGRFVGAINHDDYLKFDNVNLKGIARVTFRVASAGSGGNIELRLDSPGGALLGSVVAPVTGGWEKWTDVEMPIVATPTKHDVIVRFTNAEHHGGLMNLDWLRFDKAPPR